MEFISLNNNKKRVNVTTHNSAQERKSCRNVLHTLIYHALLVVPVINGELEYCRTLIADILDNATSDVVNMPWDTRKHN